MYDICICQNSVHSACIAYNINKKSSTSIRDTALFIYYNYSAMDYKIKNVCKNRNKLSKLLGLLRFKLV